MVESTRKLVNIHLKSVSRPKNRIIYISKHFVNGRFDMIVAFHCNLISLFFLSLFIHIAQLARTQTIGMDRKTLYFSLICLYKPCANTIRFFVLLFQNGMLISLSGYAFNENITYFLIIFFSLFSSVVRLLFFFHSFDFLSSMNRLIAIVCIY